MQFLLTTLTLCHNARPIATGKNMQPALHGSTVIRRRLSCQSGAITSNITYVEHKLEKASIVAPTIERWLWHANSSARLLSLRPVFLW
ncbi:Sulfite oxidase [Fusarium oxysporum f. sp. albedinis]|nr:Sulfite oxidase [Fusarium oxysporum f. sp. albedinis]